MKLTTITICAIILLCAISGIASAAENIALGKPYAWQDAPRYAGCTDPADTTQLTDGKFSDGPEIMWLQKSTVGWQDTMPVVVTVDLGAVQPISGAGYSTASDSDNNVAWPNAVFVLTSDDEKSWRKAGDLVRLARPDGTLPPRGHYLYNSEGLQTKGRFVRFVVVPKARYTFCDEVEVYLGPDSLLAAEPKGEVVTDLARLSRVVATNRGIQNRLLEDAKTVHALLAACQLPDAKKAALRARLDALAKAAVTLPDADPDTFTTVFPINSVHAGILAVNSAVLRSGGLPVLSAAKVDRYDYITPLVPSAPDKPSISIDMLRSEFRADAIALTNASDTPMTVRIQAKGLPGGTCPRWLTVSAIPWTDTTGGVPVATALPKAAVQNGACVVTLPAGLQTKVWLGVDSASIVPGRYQGKLLIDGGGKSIRVPFSLRVSKVRMNRPRLSLGVWDYSLDGRFGKNTNAAIKMMTSHFVDSPWSTNSAIPWPKETDFDASGRLVKAQDFTNLDRWVMTWPDARRYLVFCNVQNWYAFAGAKMGTPEFDARVGSWAKALAGHMRALKLKPQQLGLLLVDEPSTDEQDVQIVAWAKAINAAAPEITLFQDPTWAHPEKTANQQAITLADIVCPEIPGYKRGGAEVAQYYENLRETGHQMWFYQCSGPTKLLDPYRYHRLEAWHAFANGMVGEGFWSFFDTGGAASCWNEYTAPGDCYSQVFIDPKGFTTGIQWEAVREGIEDYETLEMLRDAAYASRDAGFRASALELLKTAPTAVIGNYSDNYRWNIPTDRSAADVYRSVALRFLDKTGQ